MTMEGSPGSDRMAWSPSNAKVYYSSRDAWTQPVAGTKRGFEGFADGTEDQQQPPKRRSLASLFHCLLSFLGFAAIGINDSTTPSRRSHRNMYTTPRNGDESRSPRSVRARDMPGRFPHESSPQVEPRVYYPTLSLASGSVDPAVSTSAAPTAPRPRPPNFDLALDLLGLPGGFKVSPHSHEPSLVAHDMHVMPPAGHVSRDEEQHVRSASHSIMRPTHTSVLTSANQPQLQSSQDAVNLLKSVASSDLRSSNVHPMKISGKNESTGINERMVSICSTQRDGEERTNTGRVISNDRAASNSMYDQALYLDARVGQVPSKRSIEVFSQHPSLSEYLDQTLDNNYKAGEYVFGYFEPPQERSLGFEASRVWATLMSEIRLFTLKKTFGDGCKWNNWGLMTPYHMERMHCDTDMAERWAALMHSIRREIETLPATSSSTAATMPAVERGNTSPQRSALSGISGNRAITRGLMNASLKLASTSTDLRRKAIANAVVPKSTPRAIAKVAQYFGLQSASPEQVTSIRTPPNKSVRNVGFYENPTTGGPITQTKRFYIGEAINHPSPISSRDEGSYLVTPTRLASNTSINHHMGYSPTIEEQAAIDAQLGMSNHRPPADTGQPRHRYTLDTASDSLEPINDPIDGAFSPPSPRLMTVSRSNLVDGYNPSESSRELRHDRSSSAPDHRPGQREKTKYEMRSSVVSPSHGPSSATRTDTNSNLLSGFLSRSDEQSGSALRGFSSEDYPPLPSSGSGSSFSAGSSDSEHGQRHLPKHVSALIGLEDLSLSSFTSPRRKSHRHQLLLEREAREKAARERLEAEALAARLKQEAEEKAQREKEAAELHAQFEREAEEQRKKLSQRRLTKGPIITPLSSEWNLKVAQALKKGEQTQVAMTSTGTSISRRDIGKVLPQRGTNDDMAGWLNDDIISAYLQAVVDYGHERLGHKRGATPKYHAFNPFFYTTLQRPAGYDGVKRWAKKAKIGGKDLLNVESVFIPINKGGNHWTLAVVSPTKKTIEFFDSLHGASSTIVNNIKAWLKGELGAAYKADQWHVIEDESAYPGRGMGPTQDNGSDCGVFTVTTAKMIMLGVDPMAVGAKDMPLQRRRIVAELLNGGFSGDLKPQFEFV